MKRVVAGSAALVWALCVATAVLTLSMSTPALFAQGAGAQVISSPRALADAIDILQTRYATMITYEDPVWVWSGDLTARGSDPNAKWGLFPKRGSFTLPAVATPDQTPTMTSTLLEGVIGVYQLQNAGPTFQVSISSLGLHIVPAQAHDSTGKLAPATSLLEASVVIPQAQRTVRQHFEAICGAVTASTGILLQFSATGVRPWLDELFAPNTAPAVGGQSTQESSLMWGVSGATGRQALVSLLGQSATTLTWRLFCQGSAQPRDRFCVLNLVPIKIAVTGVDGRPMEKLLSYDRCGRCPSLALQGSPLY